MPYRVRYSGLQVTAITPEAHERTCNYWYLVTCGATAHTAFTTKRGLLRWLAERGLTLPAELPAERGEYATMPAAGDYYAASHGEHSPTEAEPHRMTEGADWAQIRPVVITAAMSNGRYTLALIDERDGVRTVHTLNPNVRTRLEAADSAAMRELVS